MPRVPPFDRPASYDDLAKLPDNLVAEIVQGELHASPRPGLRHAGAASVLGSLLIGPFWMGRGGPGGWLVLFEPELHLGADVCVPDLAGWRRERLPQIPDEPFLALAPDWVCEIVSPSTAGLDRGRKLAIYARERRRELLADRSRGPHPGGAPARGGRWLILDTHVGSVPLRAVPFAEVELPLGALWAD